MHYLTERQLAEMVNHLRHNGSRKWSIANCEEETENEFLSLLSGRMNMMGLV
jgi:hypothetical protein